MDNKKLVNDIARELLSEYIPQTEAFKVLLRWLRIEHRIDLLDTGRGTWGCADIETRKIIYHGNLSLAVEDALARVAVKITVAGQVNP